MRLHAAAIPAWASLVGLIILSSIVRAWAGAATAAPWIIPDELIYSELARSVAHDGAFAVREAPFSAWTFGPLYPLLIAPIFLLENDVASAYAAVKVFNGVLMSSAAVPAYLLARRLLASSDALVVAALTVAVPSMVYSTKLMTESVSYPAFLWAALAMAYALERGTWLRYGLALAAIGVAASARFQMIVLAGALATGAIAMYLSAPRDRTGRLRAWGALALAALVAAVACALLVRARDLSLLEAGPWNVVVSTVRHFAVLELYVGVAPVVAFLLLFARRPGTPTERAFLALTASSLAWLLLVSAGYLVALAATEDVTRVRVYDRYVFYLAPLLFIALLVWVRRPVAPKLAGLVVTAVAVCLPLTIPYDGLFTGREWGVSSSTTALVPWVVVAAVVGKGALLAVVAAVVAGGLSLATVRLRGARPMRLVATVACVLVISGAVVQIGNVQVSRSASRLGVASTPAWIDGAVNPDDDVVAIWSGGEDRSGQRYWPVWESDLFNERVGRVYDLGPPMPYAPEEFRLHRRGGQLHTSAAGEPPLRAEYVLAHRTLAIEGDVIARDSRHGMVLVRVGGGPVRLAPPGP